jgi:hypothetical protein
MAPATVDMPPVAPLPLVFVLAVVFVLPLVLLPSLAAGSSSFLPELPQAAWVVSRKDHSSRWRGRCMRAKTQSTCQALDRTLPAQLTRRAGVDIVPQNPVPARDGGATWHTLTPASTG